MSATGRCDQSKPGSEPRPDLEHDDWVEWGGELIWAMGETSGGAPYGLSVAEFRRMNQEHEHGAPWARARRALLVALARVSPGGVQIDVGDVEAWGRGLSRDAFAAHVDLDPDPRSLSGPYVALLAHSDADAEYPARVRREARVLDWIWPRIRGLRVPRALALVDDERAPILVASVVTGIEIDLRMGRMPIQPWQLVAEAAAAVHAVEQPPADVLLARDRRQHRTDLLHELSLKNGLDIQPAVIRDAHAWMREHIDRDGPGALLHGDLLGHNLRLFPGMDLGAIDWEYAELGDPAHDLAIVTRGARRPFQCADGRARLLAAYNARAGIEVTGSDLRFFELALHVRWSGERSHRTQESHATIARLLREA